jgi:lipopolysaccharide/colanic/teichoic acid biosynthesis glycosyltransferase
MQGKQSEVADQDAIREHLTQTALGALRAEPSTPHQARRCVVVVGAAADIPRALQHPAVVAGRFIVSAALGLDREDSADADGVLELIDLIRREEIHSILVAGPLGQTTMRRVTDLAVLHGCDVLSVMPTEVLSEHVPAIVWSGNSPLIRLSRSDRRRWRLVAKRTFDVVLAAVALILVGPVLAILALLIRLESPGSPIFRHQRVGYKGQKFSCLKLRTMRMGAEERLRENPEMYEEYRRNHFKLPDDRDPRVTRLGAFLRRTSLDELPQLWNVMRGDMSLVGPRPVVPEELSVYGDAAEIFVSMRPGITGNWAVNGRHGVGYPHRCQMELDYVRTWSLTSDLGIILRTTSAIAKLS